MTDAEKRKVLALLDAISTWRGSIPLDLERAALIVRFEEKVLEPSLELWDELEPDVDSPPKDPEPSREQELFEALEFAWEAIHGEFCSGETHRGPCTTVRAELERLKP